MYNLNCHVPKLTYKTHTKKFKTLKDFMRFHRDHGLDRPTPNVLFIRCFFITQSVPISGY